MINDFWRIHDDKTPLARSLASDTDHWPAQVCFDHSHWLTLAGNLSLSFAIQSLPPKHSHASHTKVTQTQCNALVATNGQYRQLCHCQIFYSNCQLSVCKFLCIFQYHIQILEFLDIRLPGGCCAAHTEWPPELACNCWQLFSAFAVPRYNQYSIILWSGFSDCVHHTRTPYAR